MLGVWALIVSTARLQIVNSKQLVMMEGLDGGLPRRAGRDSWYRAPPRRAASGKLLSGWGAGNETKSMPSSQRELEQDIHGSCQSTGVIEAAELSGADERAGSLSAVYHLTLGQFTAKNPLIGEGKHNVFF